MLSRRDFLRIAGISTGAALLNACAPKAILPTPTLSPSATIAPTATPAPTITPTATPDINTLLKPEIDLYTNAYEYVAQDVANRISIVNMVDPTGNKFRAAIDPTTSIPLLVTNENGVWQAAVLKELARHGNIHVGQPKGDNVDAYMLRDDYNYLFVDCYWKWGQPQDDASFDYTSQDQLLKFAAFDDIHQIQLGSIIWAHQSFIPDWLIVR